MTAGARGASLGTPGACEGGRGAYEWALRVATHVFKVPDRARSSRRRGQQ